MPKSPGESPAEIYARTKPCDQVPAALSELERTPRLALTAAFDQLYAQGQPMRLLSSGLVAVALLAAGCVSPYYTRPGTLKPASAAVTREERTLAWQHAITALLDQGYVPGVLNESAGYLSARRREDLVSDALTGTMATVVVSPEGTIRVEVSGTGMYHSEQEFLAAVTARQNQILQAILATHAQAK